MSLTQRVHALMGALGSFAGAALMIALGEQGYLLVLVFLSVSLTLTGIRELVFYFTMARHMVDGRAALCLGVIMLDFGVFAMTITDQAGVFIAFYLLIAYAISGAIDILRALEAKKQDAGSWRLNLAEGILNIVFAFGAAVFGLVIGDMQDLTWIYASGLVYSGILKLISVFRKSAIVYIP